MEMFILATGDWAFAERLRVWEWKEFWNRAGAGDDPAWGYESPEEDIDLEWLCADWVRGEMFRYAGFRGSSFDSRCGL